jgi:hypothetical protein
MRARKTPRSPISKPGEKSIARTRKELPVNPPKRTREAAKPLPLSAIDHRDQISGTDELKATRRRRSLR